MCVVVQQAGSQSYIRIGHQSSKFPAGLKEQRRTRNSLQYHLAIPAFERRAIDRHIVCIGVSLRYATRPGEQVGFIISGKVPYEDCFFRTWQRKLDPADALGNFVDREVLLS